MSIDDKTACVSIALSLVGIALVIVERVHHGWWPF